MLRQRRVLYLSVLVNKFYNIYFKCNGRFTDSKLFYHLNKFRILLQFFEKFSLLVNQTMFFLAFNDFLEFSNYCCRIFSFLNFADFFFQLFVAMSFIIDNRIFKFLLYFFFPLSCFTACFQDVVKVLFLKFKNKVEQVLK